MTLAITLRFGPNRHSSDETFQSLNPISPADIAEVLPRFKQTQLISFYEGYALLEQAMSCMSHHRGVISEVRILSINALYLLFNDVYFCCFLLR